MVSPNWAVPDGIALPAATLRAGRKRSRQFQCLDQVLVVGRRRGPANASLFRRPPSEPARGLRAPGSPVPHPRRAPARDAPRGWRRGSRGRRPGSSVGARPSSRPRVGPADRDGAGGPSGGARGGPARGRVSRTARTRPPAAVRAPPSGRSRHAVVGRRGPRRCATGARRRPIALPVAVSLPLDSHLQPFAGTEGRLQRRAEASVDPRVAERSLSPSVRTNDRSIA